MQAVVQLALRLDAAGDRNADTLYSDDAVVVGNARVRQAAPRFAGVTIGAGRVTVWRGRRRERFRAGDVFRL